MLTPTPILLLSLFTLLAAAAPVPQEGNQQFDLHNKSPSPTLAPSTASPTAAAAAATATPSTARDLSAAVAAEALKKNPKQPITGDDGMTLGMAAAMEGLGTATGALSGLPLAGGLGGLGARDESKIQNQNKKRTPQLPGLDLLKKLPIIGSLGGRDESNIQNQNKKRTPQVPGLDLLKKLPIIGGLGSRDESNIQNQNKKRTPQVPGLDLLKKLPLGGLANLGGRDTSKLNRRDAQLSGDVLGSLPILSSLFGGNKVKREETDAQPPLPGTEKATIAEEREEKKVKKRSDPLSSIKKFAAIVADVRGVTSKVKRRGFSKGIIDSTKAKLDSQFNSVFEEAERTENTSFPPGLPVKTPQDALDKRFDNQDEEHRAEYVQEEVYEDVFPVAHPHEEHEKYEGLQNTYETHEELKRQPLDLPTNELVGDVTGVKGVVDTVKSLSSAWQNRNS
ncbi:hypothetical protein B9Z19DRAFT_1197543 [Tuber borchii]|uniref:Uncharacterized protein n=1 Tax=Tuber borchii TaxID=42251 RepID=A0A2T6ZAD4_TUBBO|nr:hypothetical protein B9Z19DRAFT_1197543 [Tuber borchii]